MSIKSISLSLLLLAIGQCAIAEEMKMPTNAKDLKWGPAPPVLPKGAQIAVVSGDPFKDEPWRPTWLVRESGTEQTLRSPTAKLLKCQCHGAT
jgi:hypothetical protein